VLAADGAEKLGLSLPPLSEEVQAELRQFTPIAGTSVRNPLDTVPLEAEGGLRKTVEIVGRSPGINAILVIARLDWGLPRTKDVDAFVQGTVNGLVESARQSPVPLALVARAADNAKVMAAMEKFYDLAAKAAVATYPDLRRALSAIARFISWHEARDSLR
jgi:acyl-CoA synthetase (NDP forming)